MRKAKKPQLPKPPRKDLFQIVGGGLSALFLGQPLARRMTVSAEISKAKRGTLPAAFLYQPSETRSTKRRIIDLYLPPDEFLTRTINIPPAAKRKAADIARLDLIRRTPFQPKDVHSLLSAANRDGDHFTCTQIIIERDTLAQYKRNLATHGYRLRRVYARVPSFAEPIADFTASVAPRRKLWLSINAFLAASACAAFATTFVLPVTRTQQATAELSQEINSLQTEALTLRQAIDAEQAGKEERAALIDLIRYSPKMTDTLRNLTVAMPDHAWAENMNFQPNRVVVSGETAGAAADLVLQLTNAAAFTNPRLSGATARTADGHERFEISLDLGDLK